MLSPLAEASTILEGKHYPTSNLVLPYIYGSIAALARDAATTQTWDNQLLLANDLHEDVAHARRCLHIAMEARWVTNIDKEKLRFLCVATLLDPRLLSLPIPLFTPEMKKQARDDFLSEFDMNWAPVPADEAAEGAAGVPAAEDSPVNIMAVQVPAALKRDGSLGSWMLSVSHLNQQPATPAPQQRVSETEAEKYLKLVPELMTTDVLDWWATHEAEFPNLARMARQFLGCPATSASAERVFSLAGRLYNDLRQHMTDGTLEERMWAKVNFD